MCPELEPQSRLARLETEEVAQAAHRWLGTIALGVTAVLSAQLTTTVENATMASGSLRLGIISAVAGAGAVLWRPRTREFPSAE